MKKQITIEGEGLFALHSMVSSASFNSRAEGRKINTLANWLKDPLQEYKDAVKAVFDKYAVETTDEKTGKTVKDVPQDKVIEHNKEMEAVRLHPYTVVFDKESFSFAETIVDGLFTRKEIQDQSGLVGLESARNMEQISVAFEKAVDVD